MAASFLTWELCSLQSTNVTVKMAAWRWGWGKHREGCWHHQPSTVQSSIVDMSDMFTFWIWSLMSSRKLKLWFYLHTCVHNWCIVKSHSILTRGRYKCVSEFKESHQSGLDLDEFQHETTTTTTSTSAKVFQWCFLAVVLPLTVLYLFRFMFNLHCVILSAEQESLNIIYNTIPSG